MFFDSGCGTGRLGEAGLAPGIRRTGCSVRDNADQRDDDRARRRGRRRHSTIA